MIRVFKLLILLSATIATFAGKNLAVAGDAKAKQPTEGPPFSFFAMDTGLRGADVPDLKSKVALLKKLGYAGIGYTYNPRELPKLLELLDAQGLELSAIYMSPAIEDKLDPTLAETVKLLQGRRTRLEMALRSKKLKPSDPSGDGSAVALLRQLSDLVGNSGPVVSVYPHTNFWAERVEDGIRLAQKVERKNVGTHFNLVHWKWVKQTRDLPDLLKDARPHLMCVTVNGLTGKQIVSLEKGDYDIDAFLKLLKSTGYRGPVGLQGYSVPGPSAGHLQRSMTRWQEAMKKL